MKLKKTEPNLKMMKTIRMVEMDSQEKIAHEIGTTKSQYSRKERGEIAFTLKEYIAFCNYYNVDFSFCLH